MKTSATRGFIYVLLTTLSTYKKKVCLQSFASGIGGLLRTREKLWFSYQSFASGPSLIGLVVGVIRIVLPLDFLSSIRMDQGMLLSFCFFFSFVHYRELFVFPLLFFFNNIPYSLSKKKVCLYANMVRYNLFSHFSLDKPIYLVI